MPGKVKVKIMSGRNLPVMDRSSDTTDAYVEIKLGNTTYKTDVCRKSLHPTWNSEWYRFELDDSELQDEPLQIRLMDHDTYSANDAIGKVYIDLNPLLLPAASLLLKSNWNGEACSSTSSVMSGWLPVYDTMHGIRGEVNVTVKVELFSDSNKFRQSSCGVHFFCSKAIPYGYHAETVHGFVEELVVNDDPEYQWIDKIRTPRASNEARQTSFFKLSGELQRKIGLKVLDLGGNAVVGYSQSFDLEGESGIVARGIGTAVTLVKMSEVPSQLNCDQTNEERSLNYLQFLGYKNSFRLNMTPSLQNPVPSKKPHLVKQNSVDIYSDVSLRSRRKQFTRHLSHMDFDDKTVREGHHMQHSASLQTLLKQEDNRGIPGHGISQKLKNLKYSSQSMLSKKMGALKAKLGESTESDIKTSSAAELVEQTVKKPFKFKRTSSDSSVMAELLVRSIIQAQNSLDCIVEVQDSSPPKLEKLEENEKPNKGKLNPLDQKAKSDSYLALPQSSFDTHSSVGSYTESSTSDDDEHSSEHNLGFETVSSVLKDVRLIERKLSLRERPLPIQGKFVVPEGIKEDSVSPESDEELEDEPKEHYTIEEDILENQACREYQEISPEREDSEPIPPFAESDNFSIADSDEYQQAQFKIVGDSDVDENQMEESIKEDAAPEKEPNSKLIIPPVMIGANIKSQSLMKTAMQTMLLEKVNIMGTYSPPMSPVATEKPMKAFYSPTESAASSPPKHDVEESFFPHISKTFERVRQSPTTLSLTEMSTSKETVLGAPFTSMHNIQTKSTGSDTNIKKPHSAEQITNREFSVPPRCLKSEERLLDSPGSLQVKPMKTRRAELSKSDDLQRTFSVDRLFKKRLTFLRRSRAGTEKVERRRSHEPTITVEGCKKKDHVPEFLSNIFCKSEKKSFRHNKGLLGAALKNVAMETVQDILATSHTEQKNKNRFIPFSSSAVLNSANTITSSSSLSTPANTEIDKGCISNNNMHASLTTDNRISVSPEPTRIEHGHYRTESVGNKMAFSPAKPNSAPSMHRRSSDSDLSITPKGNSLTGSDKSGVGYIGQRSAQMVHSGIHQDNFELLEYPFLTMSKYPQQFIMYLGGIVSARSVKLLERITNIEEPESRDMWWSELRLEIRSHARTLNCNSVLGYSETTTICEDVCVLSAIGTAAIIGYHYNEVGDTVMNIPPTPSAKTKESVPSTEQSDKEKLHAKTDPITMPTDISGSHPASPEHDGLSYAVYNTTPCSICHLPYSLSTSIRVVGTKCSMCRRGKVPDVLITTTELPDEMPTVGRGCILQAYVCRPLKELKGESNAKEISDALPFVEYELHRILVNKLKIKGMNSIFGLKVRISIGERLLIGIATGTAAFLTALPAPPIPVLVSDQSTDESTLSKLQKQLSDTVRKNREMYQLTRTDDMQNGTAPSDNEDSEGEQGTLDLSNGNKEPCILEIDGPEDKEILSFLTEPIAPAGFHVVNTEFVPGLEGLEIVKNLQMFTQIWRGKTPTTASLGKYVQNLLQSVYFKLRRMIPCALCNVQFIINLPEPEEIQMCVLGMALGLTDSPRAVKNKKKTITNDDMIFNLEDDQINDNEQSSPSQLQSHSLRGRSKSPLKNRFFPSKQTHMPYRERHGVDITPLSYVPGGKIEKYLGNLNFFFIRETTSIREEGGLSGFIHSFVTEALAILRAHVAALGGNALVAYFMTKCILNHNLHKNQGQCLINIGGDVVYVSYFNEENA